MTARVLLVEDSQMAEQLAEELRERGYAVDVVDSMKAAFQQIVLLVPDILLLGQHLINDEDGLVALTELTHKQPPIIFLQRDESQSEKILALKVGADDVVSIPGDIRMLDARIQAVLHRWRHQMVSAGLESEILQVGELQCWITRFEIRIKGERVHFTTTEYKALKLLMQYPGRIFSRNEFAQSIWGLDNYGHSLDVHLGRIRVKFRKAGLLDVRIDSVRNRGFRLTQQEGKREDP